MKRDFVEMLLQEKNATAVPALMNTGPSILVREDREGLSYYPNPCPVEYRMIATRIGAAVVAAWMVRIADLNRATFETWINVRDPEGIGRELVDALTTSPHIHLHIYVNNPQPKRSIVVPNMMQKSAAALLAESDAAGSWSMADFDVARAAVEARYTTPLALWAAAAITE